METERENIVRDGHRWTGKGIIRHHDEPGASWAVMRSDQTRFSIQRFRGVRFILELNAVDRGGRSTDPSNSRRHIDADGLRVTLETGAGEHRNRSGRPIGDSIAKPAGSLP